MQRAGTGQFIIALAGWLFRNDAGQAGEVLPGSSLPQPVKDDQNQEEDSFFPGEEVLPPDLNPDHDQQAEGGRATGSRVGATSSRGGTGSGAIGNRVGAIGDRVGPTRPTPAQARREQKQSALPRKLEARLREAGVFPVLLSEVGARAAQDGYSPAELVALLDWCLDDQPDRAAALFIGRLRAGARAPAAYKKPACSRCGLRGKHGPECPRRYALDGL